MSNLIESDTSRVESDLRPKPKAKQVIDRPDSLHPSSGESAGALGALHVGALVLNWPNKNEVWPLLSGSLVSGVLAGATGFYINYKIRNLMVMLHVGRISTYSAVAVFPTLSALLTHQIFITHNILEQKTKCPVCVQVKSGVLQSIVGIVYPCVIAPVALFPILSRMTKSFKMPNVVKNPKEAFQFYKEISKPFRKYLIPITAFQVITMMGLTYLEQDAYFTNVVPYLNPKINSLLKDVK